MSTLIQFQIIENEFQPLCESPCIAINRENFPAPDHVEAKPCLIPVPANNNCCCPNDFQVSLPDVTLTMTRFGTIVTSHTFGGASYSMYYFWNMSVVVPCNWIYPDFSGEYFGKPIVAVSAGSSIPTVGSGGVTVLVSFSFAEECLAQCFYVPADSVNQFSCAGGPMKLDRIVYTYYVPSTVAVVSPPATINLVGIPSRAALQTNQCYEGDYQLFG